MQIDTATIVELVKFVGVPAALLVALLWFLYRICTYFADKIVEPVAKRHMEFLDDIAKLSKQNADTDVRFADSLEVLSESAKENEKTNAIIAGILERQLDQRKSELTLFQGLITQVMTHKAAEGVRGAEK